MDKKKILSSHSPSRRDTAPIQDKKLKLKHLAFIFFFAYLIDSKKQNWDLTLAMSTFDAKTQVLNPCTNCHSYLPFSDQVRGTGPCAVCFAFTPEGLAKIHSN